MHFEGLSKIVKFKGIIYEVLKSFILFQTEASSSLTVVIREANDFWFRLVIFDIAKLWLLIYVFTGIWDVNISKIQKAKKKKKWKQRQINIICAEMKRAFWIMKWTAMRFGELK